MAQNTDLTRALPKRAPTINDIRFKKCWICLEEEVAGNGQPAGDWCHPCKCSLVCHGKCLLEWMKAQEGAADRPGGPIKCPQCGTQYILISYQPQILRIFDRIHSRAWLLGAAGAISGLVLSTAGVVLAVGGIYGAYAFESFVGKQAFDLVFPNDLTQWSPWAVFDLITIPWTLWTVGYKKSLLFNFTSILCSYPLSLAMGRTDNVDFTFPPNPFTTLAMFPFLFPIRNLVYSRLEDWVKRKAAVPFTTYSSHRPAMHRLQYVDGVPDVIVDIIDARANPRPADGQALPDDPANRVVGPVGINLNRVLRGSGIGSAIIKPLFIPWISKHMGSFLLTLSDYWAPLKPILGVRKSKLPKIQYVGKLPFGVRTWNWNQLDPVWWRNSLGLIIFSALYDGFQLWYTYLIERERNSRRVVSRSFEGIDIASLDLIPNA